MSIMDRLVTAKPRTTQETFLDTVVAKLIENLPPETLGYIKLIAEKVSGFDERLSRIENALAIENGRAGHSVGLDAGIPADDSSGE